MSQSSNKRTYQVSLRRLPSIRTGITLIWLENPSLLSRECDETINRLRVLDNCHILCYKNVSACFKYLKRARSYERIIIVMNVYNDSIITADISRLCQYRQIQSIFVMSLSANKDNCVAIDLSANIRDEIAKLGGIFHDYQALFDRLKKLMDEIDEFDDDLFTFFNRPEKALRDLRHELGPYIWSQALRGNFI